MLDYKLIEALAMVAREGSFEKAAKALYITQSAVSQRIRALEEGMGQVLIIRATPPRLTPTGRRILKHFLQVKQLEEDLTTAVGGKAANRFSSLAIGVNADSLSLWIMEAVQSFLAKEQVELELRVDDQEQTGRFLRDGEVMACISSQQQAIQGCRVTYLGQMNYRMLAAPEFASHYFSNGFTRENAGDAPAVIFDRNDDLHGKFLQRIFAEKAITPQAHYVPAVVQFAECIVRGLGYGTLPDQQSAPLLNRGQLIDLLPGHCVSVDLFWHCWNLKSSLLEKLTQHLISNAKILLSTA